MSKTKKTLICLTASLILVFLIALNASAYVSSMIHWNKTSVLYGITSDVPAEWKTVIQNNVNKWNGVSRFSFSNVNIVTSYYKTGNLGSSGGALGITSLTWLSDGTITKAITTLNTYYPLAPNPTPYDYDLPSVVIHEAGHWLYLGDLYGSGDTGSVMYATLAKGQFRQSLSQDDINGIRSIYGN